MFLVCVEWLCVRIEAMAPGIQRVLTLACAAAFLGFFLLRLTHEVHRRSHQGHYPVEYEAMGIESWDPFSHHTTVESLMKIPSRLLAPRQYGHWDVMDVYLGLDYAGLRLCLAIELLDYLFIFTFTMLLVDLLTISLLPITGGSGAVQYLDALPAIAALADMAENFCFIGTLLRWPDTSPFPLTEYASVFTTIKCKVLVLVGGTIILCAIVSVASLVTGGRAAKTKSKPAQKVE